MLGIKVNHGQCGQHESLRLYTALVLSGGMEAQARPTRRVLILNETGTSYPAINTIDQGIRAGLQDAPYRLEFYREYMETVLFPDPKTQQEFRDFYLRKYQNRKPDVIITVGPSPLQFMLETHERAFAGVPVIFCLPYGPLPGTLTLDAGITGVTKRRRARHYLGSCLAPQARNEARHHSRRNLDTGQTNRGDGPAGTAQLCRPGGHFVSHEPHHACPIDAT